MQRREMHVHRQPRTQFIGHQRLETRGDRHRRIQRHHLHQGLTGLRNAADRMNAHVHYLPGHRCPDRTVVDFKLKGLDLIGIA
ncbi:hypothetical protein D3C76_1374160 [compost metagenome]